LFVITINSETLLIGQLLHKRLDQWFPTGGNMQFFQRLEQVWEPLILMVENFL